MPDQPEGLPPPQALAAAICDAVWRQPGTMKRFVLGFVDSFFSPIFPATLIFGVFVDLTDGYGVQEIKLQVIDADELRPPVWSKIATVNFGSPKDVIELDYMVPNAEFPEPGEYRFQVYANDQYVIERRLIANKLEMPAP